jgi:DNA-binding Lrp family transcriptional regulator
MQQSFNSLSQNEKKFLKALLEDGSRNDSELADEIGVSKSTANRIRRDFEETGVIEDYIPIIDLEGIGVNLYGVFKGEINENLDTEELTSDSRVIFLGESGDFRKKIIMFAGFSSYTDYKEFLDKLREEKGEKLEQLDIDLISPKDIQKEDFTHLIQHRLNESLGESNE